jgi:hypothetical protein
MGKPTRRTSLKTIAQGCKPGSATQVAIHGTWQRLRHRQPSMSYDGEANPQKAYAQALRDLGLSPVNVTTQVIRSKADLSYRRRMSEEKQYLPEVFPRGQLPFGPLNEAGHYHS